MEAQAVEVRGGGEIEENEEALAEPAPQKPAQKKTRQLHVEEEATRLRVTEAAEVLDGIKDTIDNHRRDFTQD